MKKWQVLDDPTGEIAAFWQENDAGREERIRKHYQYMAQQPCFGPLPRPQMLAQPPILRGDAFADPVRGDRRPITILKDGVLKRIGS